MKHYKGKSSIVKKEGGELSKLLELSKIYHGDCMEYRLT